MDIKLGTTFTLFQAGRKRLNPSYFLCVFRDVDANEIRQAITQSIGDAVGPLLLELTEGTSDPLNGVVQLYSGDWVLTVYEQTSATNLDASNANRTVWSELVRVSAQCDADPGPQPYDPCDGCPGGGTLCEEVEDSTAAEIVACIAEADKTEAVQALLCDPCDPTTVNGTESDTPTITVLQGGNPVGTLNPATGVVTIEECPEGCDEPFTLQFLAGETLVDVAAYPDPCGDTGVISCDTLVDAVVVEGAGTEEANGVYLPDGIVNGLPSYIGTLYKIEFSGSQWFIRDIATDEGFYASSGDNELPWLAGPWDAESGPPAPAVRQATISDLCCVCPPPEPCEDATVTWDGQPFLEIASGDTTDIDCNTPIPAAYLLDGGSRTGTYKIDGTVNGKPRYRLDANNDLEYNGTRWENVHPGPNELAAPGNEDFPWLADWSGTSITVTQATIGQYCDDCPECEPLQVTVNGLEGPTVNAPCGETVALTVEDSEGDPVTVTVDPLTGVVTVPALPCAPCPDPPPSNVLREYTSGATWNKPSSTDFQGVWIFAAGAGGGGASGRQGATNQTGGSGGGGGALVRRWVPAASLGLTETIAIGTGGAGGVNAAGTAGGDTSFGAHAIAKGGNGGLYANTTTVAGGAGGDVLACTPVASGLSDSGGQGGLAARTTASTGAGLDGMAVFAGPGGGGGGGYTSGGGATGGAGGGVYQAGVITTGGAGGTASNNGTAGVNDVNLNPFSGLIASTIGYGTAGGGGGGSGAAGNTGGTGGAGGRGAGGGGGGAGVVTAGSGGAGGNGFVIIYEVFGS